MRWLLCLALLVGPATAGKYSYGTIDAPRDTTPLELGAQFCAARIAGDMTPVASHFAPKLVTALALASDPQDVPWQSRSETPQTCTPAILNGFDDTIGVLVELTYHSGEALWRDVLNLERTVDSWQINNVFYEGGGNLRFRLLGAR